MRGGELCSSAKFPFPLFLPRATQSYCGQAAVKWLRTAGRPKAAPFWLIVPFVSSARPDSPPLPDLGQGRLSSSAQLRGGRKRAQARFSEARLMTGCSRSLALISFWRRNVRSRYNDLVIKVTDRLITVFGGTGFRSPHRAPPAGARVLGAQRIAAQLCRAGLQGRLRRGQCGEPLCGAWS